MPKVWRKILPFISLSKVYYSYDKENMVFSGLDLDLGPGEITAITGPNGSGKTTLSKLVMGILKPDSGKVYLDGNDVDKMTLGEVGSKIGYLFQNPEMQIFANTVFDELSFVLRLKGLEEDKIEVKVNRLLEDFNLKDYKDASPFNLSFGEKQRLAIAGVLINEPRYLILDEPTTGLDYKRKRQLRDILDGLFKKGIGFSLITHDLDFIQHFGARVIKFSKKGELC